MCNEYTIFTLVTSFPIHLKLESPAVSTHKHMQVEHLQHEPVDVLLLVDPLVSKSTKITSLEAVILKYNIVCTVYCVHTVS